MGTHIREIKLRMQYVFFSVILTFFCSYFFSEQIIYILATPLEQARSSRNGTPFHFIFTELTEAFFASITVGLFVTFGAGLWIVIYQFWLFIKPGLYFYEKRSVGCFLFLSFFLSVLSVLVAYWLILPATCKFFLSFESGTSMEAPLHIYMQAKMSMYINNTCTLLF